MFQGVYNGQTYRDRGVIQENRPLEKISYTYWSGFSGLEDKPENYSLVTYLIHAAEDKTTLTWTNKGYATEDGYKHSLEGMPAFMEQIKAIAER